MKAKMGLLKKLWRDERGQSTTEYILILSVVVMIAMQFRKQIGKTLAGLLNKVETDMNSATSGSLE